LYARDYPRDVSMDCAVLVPAFAGMTPNERRFRVIVDASYSPIAQP
jgi:hypothetical protein